MSNLAVDRRPLISVILATMMLVIFIGWGVTRVVLYVQFEQTIEGRLKRAADANTVSLATKELSAALTEVQRQELMSGYTSVLWRTPDEDVGFWYVNLVASLGELNRVKSDASQLEQSNVLMKLRETLLDNTKNGVKTTAPDGISVFPRNTVFVFWGWGSILLFLVFIVGAVVVSHRRY